MKTLGIFLISCLTATTVVAQTTSSVTINLNTNRYQEVLVDGQSYAITPTTNTTGMNGVVTITGLTTGQHKLELVRVNPNTGARRTNTRNFNVRSRFDLAITVNNDGSIELKETRNSTAFNRGSRTPMTDADFSVLLQNIQSQRRASARTTSVTNAINAVNNYFTTAQASELLELVTSESKRFTLAKTVYPKITDPLNFSLVYDLFDSQANRDALDDYVSTYNANHPTYNSYAGYSQAMSEADFTNLVNSVKRQWLPGAKMLRLTDIFANTNYYFTVSQAKQLIQLVSDENNRLQLAKSAYARIVDPNNFSQLYSLFTSQARIDELQAYVNSQSNNR